MAILDLTTKKGGTKEIKQKETDAQWAELNSIDEICNFFILKIFNMKNAKINNQLLKLKRKKFFYQLANKNTFTL